NIDGSVNAQKIEVREAPNPPGFIRFLGRITALPNTQDLVGDWKVGERVVHVSANTKIDQDKAKAAVGALVEVEGMLRNDRSVDAMKIEVKSAVNDTANFIRFFGEISSLPPAQSGADKNDSGGKLVRDWTIGGKNRHLGERTPLPHAPAAPRI